MKVIQKIEVRENPKTNDAPPPGDFYAYVWTSEAEMKLLKTMLGDFAKLGLVVAVSKPVYATMKAQDVRRARLTVKEFTRHNDKLGFDFSIPNNGYYVSYSEQFSESAYGKDKGFLSQAVAFYKEKGMTDTASHFEKMITKFQLNADKGVKADFQVPTNLTEERFIQGYLVQIEDLTLRLRKTQDELEESERENRHNRETIQGYNNSVVLSPH